MKTHTFYVNEAQRNNLVNYLGLAICKLREEMNSDTPLQSEREYEHWIADAESIQAFFELHGSASLPSSDETGEKIE